jgi:CRISPR-associated endonuclease/helicase Cas3
MQPLNQILAKSIDRGGTTLIDHIRHVVIAIKVFAENYDLNIDIDIAIKAAVLHDVGKAHPHFQRKIHKIKAKSINEESEWNYAHRHELSSLGFLSLFPEEEWSPLIDMVVAHHKSTKDDKSTRGIIDLAQTNKFWLEDHLIDWHKWSLQGLEIMKQLFKEFGIDEIMIKEISIKEAKINLEYVLSYCKTKPLGWSPLRGLLMSADHFASAFINNTSSQLKDLFAIPDLSFYKNPNRGSALYPLSKIDTTNKRPHTMVVAPTGAGKTDFLLKRCTGRIFYTLPFQASINAMYERIKGDIKNENPNTETQVRVLHSTSALLVKGNKDAENLQHFGGASIKVLTPHQLASIIFGTAEFESMMLDLKGSDIIFDEIHTYSDVGRSMVLEIIRTLLRLNCRIHIGTATMPSLLYNEVLQILQENGEVYEVKLEDEVLDEFDRHVVHKMEDETEIDAVLENAFQQKEKVLVIFNTVKKAQEEFRRLTEEAFPEMKNKAMLIHSRFRRSDRFELEKRLKTEFNGDGSKQSGDGLMPCLVIATQVVEVSLDISFDRMITQVAPLDAMIQRFGRVNRKRSKDTIGKYKPVHVIQLSGSALPYKAETLKASYNQLKDDTLLKERSLQDKIDIVYPSLDTKPIDIHLIYHDGQYKIRELCHRRSAVIVEALEIQSATCILRCDREKYLDAKWGERIQMEIPISIKTMARYRNQYEQLEHGSHPYVIPQDEANHLKYGLELVEPEIFI